MIERLSVRDFILVESLSLEFTGGFNVLSGETGAGKSILVGALSVLFGGKGGADLVRDGADEAVVAGEFLVAGHDSGLRWLEEHGVTPEDGGVLIRRTIKTSGRGTIHIGATPVTRGELEEFAGLLLDLHSQHEHQSLFSEPQHRRILDRFGGFDDDVRAFHEEFERLSELQQRLREVDENEAAWERELEMLRFAVEEIEAAAVTEGEYEQLEAERDRLSQFEKLAEHVRMIAETLDGNEYAALPLIKRSRTEFTAALRIDGELANEHERLESAYYELEDIAQNLATYRENLRYDPARLEEIEDRLALLKRLRKKYGADEREVLAYAASARRKLDEASSAEVDRESMRKEIRALEQTITERARAIHQRRVDAAAVLTERIEAVLRELAMGSARFVVDIATRTNDRGRLVCGPYGADRVRFLISTNEGIDPQPLVRVASGGELSRVMLAIKTIIADVDDVRSLVFDEIDTGVGGQVALAIASHMRSLADRSQVIAITHLATIAVRADNHIVVEKGTDSGVTRISARALRKDDRVREVARMLAGEQEESTAIEHARVLLERYQRVSDGQDK